MTMQRKITFSLLAAEIDFSTSRSGGPGGQNVNKVNSKVSLRFHVGNSAILVPEEKDVIFQKLKSFITKDGDLILHAQGSRSQFDNKEVVIAKFDTLMEKAFRKKKARKATKPSKTSVQKRISEKKQHGEKKRWRQSLD